MSNPIQIVKNYFEQGYRFHRTHPTVEAAAVSPVFLIHGWGVRSASMADLARSLTEHGYTVFNYDYPSAEHSIPEHADIFLELYRNILRTENVSGSVRFVTHSMGGLILRAAIAKMTEAECRQIDAIVMLGPPNRGSFWASLGGNLVKPINASLADMSLAQESFVNSIPTPPYLPPVGIITGKFDGKVAFGNTSLPDGQPFKRITVNCTHPELRDPENTLYHILHFFSRKEFDETAAEKRSVNTPRPTSSSNGQFE